MTILSECIAAAERHEATHTLATMESLVRAILAAEHTALESPENVERLARVAIASADECGYVGCKDNISGVCVDCDVDFERLARAVLREMREISSQ